MNTIRTVSLRISTFRLSDFLEVSSNYKIIESCHKHYILILLCDILNFKILSHGKHIENKLISKILGTYFLYF